MIVLHVMNLARADERNGHVRSLQSHKRPSSKPRAQTASPQPIRGVGGAKWIPAKTNSGPAPPCPRAWRRDAVGMEPGGPLRRYTSGE